MEELNGVNLLNLSSRSKPKKGKKKSTTIKIPSQTQDSTTKTTVGEDEEGDITAKNRACKPQ